jgi:hypothetical protein
VELEETHRGIPITRPCECVLAIDIVKNLEKGWVGLAKAPKIPESPLLDLVNQDAYVTADEHTFRSHLKHVGIRQGRNWSFLVASDADLIVAWLGSVSLSGREILDPDAASVSSAHLTLVDLVVPPDLLILRLGVKTAANKEMSKVFLETLSHRNHIQKPTWVLDQPHRRFDPGHLCYSDGAVNIMSEWEHFTLNETTPGLAIEYIGSHDQSDDSTLPTPSLTLSGAQGARRSGAQRVERAPAPEKKKKYPRGGES